MHLDVTTFGSYGVPVTATLPEFYIHSPGRR
jgi:hypothetical protein